MGGARDESVFHSADRVLGGADRRRRDCGAAGEVGVGLSGGGTELRAGNFVRDIFGGEYWRGIDGGRERDRLPDRNVGVVVGWDRRASAR